MKTPKIYPLLDHIEVESEGVHQMIDTLLAEMAGTPHDQRHGDAWGPSGTFAKRFMELMHHQAELAGKLVDASKAVNAPAPQRL